ncbi:FKBP-type peptidyl-prolyl cis-trans isomerase [Croceivirga thetidis]|uniref:peptidylprolyl isomerase n=1 Tax=Croceivirga thetidis TaxID=2721623 RepID=A0ABX1GUC3_9FLAO|nr:hypothetical protein [Croceivirga thetidis]NKI33511.1 hypothetical protein [Croceivirga thetidis]
MLKKILPVFIVVLIASCGDDDDSNLEIVPPRLLADQIIEDDAAIQEYLATHFYELQTDPVFGGQRVVIDTIAGDNAGKDPMINDANLGTKVVNVSSNQVNLVEEENDIPHTLYYIIAREGEGISPTVADSTLLKYEGYLLNRTKFDAVSDFVWQELPNFLRGYANGIAELTSGTSEGLVQNGDGTSYYNDSGIGIIIMPSGLGYFLASPSTAIPSYSPLVFTVEVGNIIENTDTDNDGVPSILEDLNGNGYLFDDNTDSESELSAGVFARADFQDTDDDDDGIPTRTEISDAEGNIIFPYPGSENGGVPDYLNPDVQRDPNDN